MAAETPADIAETTRFAALPEALPVRLYPAWSSDETLSGAMAARERAVWLPLGILLYNGLAALNLESSGALFRPLLWAGPLLLTGLGGAALGLRRIRGMRWLKTVLNAAFLGMAVGSPVLDGWLLGDRTAAARSQVFVMGLPLLMALGGAPLFWTLSAVVLGALGTIALWAARGDPWNGAFWLAAFAVQAGGMLWLSHQRLRTETGRAGEPHGHDTETALSLETPGVDRLTGAFGRAMFDAELALAFEGEPGGNIAVLLIDVDHFKAFNQIYGYPAGDRCLATLAGVMQQQLRTDIDLLARYRGQEFAALLPGADLGDAARVAERIRQAIEDLAIPHSGQPDSILTVSIGLASTPRGLSGPDRLINTADAALYAAKQAGRNRVAPQLSRSFRSG